MKKTFLVFIFLVCVYGASAQFKSGMIISGGKGSLSNMKLSDEIINKSEVPFWLSRDYKFNAALGYKFRFQPKTMRFFYDIDLHLGVRQIKFEYSNFHYQYNEDGSLNWDSDTETYGASVSESCYYFSINPSWNYRIIKGLHAGVGIEPTFYSIDFDKFKFDTPLTARIGYDFRFIDVAFIYKVGLFNTMDPDYLSSGRFDDWQIQVFIPF